MPYKVIDNPDKSDKKKKSKDKDPKRDTGYRKGSLGDTKEKIRRRKKMLRDI